MLLSIIIEHYTLAYGGYRFRNISGGNEASHLFMNETFFFCGMSDFRVSANFILLCLRKKSGFDFSSTAS